MTRFDPARLAKICSDLHHPVIDADGHMVEFMPAVREEIVALGGESTARVIDTFLDAPRLARGLDVEARRALGMFRLSWWALPAENTLDRAASMLPGLVYERLPAIGIDFAVVYPTLGLMIGSIDDTDARRAVARAFNRFYAASFDEFTRRLTPAAVIPMHTPEEAIAELDYAVGELGLRAVERIVVEPRQIAHATQPNGGRVAPGRSQLHFQLGKQQQRRTETLVAAHGVTRVPQGLGQILPARGRDRPGIVFDGGG